ncbi:MAG: hypothetical protein ABI488_09995 [Polyangiaceae bacterium]
MARPIEPTPVLEGAAAERLLAQLESVCSPAEAQARMEWARTARAEMMRPKNAPRSDSGKR